MNISITSILLSLGGNCLINWALVFFQRQHICKSFMGVFAVSLAVVDTTLTLSVATLHIHPDGQVFLLGLKLTRYHICLLVQIVGQVYSALQWPVVVLAGVDHLCTVTRRLQPNNARFRWFVFLFVTFLLWYFSAFYVFLMSDFIPALEDVDSSQIHQCRVYSCDIVQVALFFLLALCCAVVHAGCSRPLKQSRSDSSRSVVHQALYIFLHTWSIFLFFQFLLLLLPVGLPAYLGLNTGWLYFFNSLLIALVLCVVCPASQLAQGLAAVPPDSFCEWRFKFSLAAEDRTCTKKHTQGKC